MLLKTQENDVRLNRANIHETYQRRSSETDTTW